MNTYAQKISLDISARASYQCTVNAKQSDNRTRYIVVQLTEDNAPIVPDEGLDAYFRGIRPDKKVFFNNALINEDGTITIELTNAVLGVAGTVNAEIVLMNADNDIISTVSFMIDVKTASFDDSAALGSNEFLALVNAINRTKKSERKVFKLIKALKELINETNDAVNSANQATATATVTKTNICIPVDDWIAFSDSDNENDDSTNNTDTNDTATDENENDGSGDVEDVTEEVELFSIDVDDSDNSDSDFDNDSDNDSDNNSDNNNDITDDTNDTNDSTDTDTDEVAEVDDSDFEGGYNYYCDVAVESMTEDTIPYFNVFPSYCSIAKECDLCPTAKGLESIVRFYANEIPIGDIKARLALLHTTDITTVESEEDTPYELPIASDSILGGVKVGNGLSIDEDGVLSIGDSVLIETDLVDEDEVEQAVIDILNGVDSTDSDDVDADNTDSDNNDGYVENTEDEDELPF